MKKLLLVLALLPLLASAETSVKPPQLGAILNSGISGSDLLLVYDSSAGITKKFSITEADARWVQTEGGGGGGGDGVWGSITGTLSDQSDLQAALNLKSPLANPTFSGTITTPLSSGKAVVTNGSSALAVASATGVAKLTSGALSASAVNLASEVTGNLPVTNLNSGTSASNTTFWRGDGTWATPAGGGGDWGDIGGTLADQTDLQSALDAKAPTASPTFSGTITTPLTASNFIVTDASSRLAAGGATSSLVTLTGSQTLTNKTLTSPALAGATWSGTTATGLTASSVLATDGSGNLTTFGLSSSVVTLTGSQTLTNKTLTAPIISTISNSGTITLPTSTDTLVGKATTDTLTNKTLTSPALNSATIGTQLTFGNYHVEPVEVDDGNSSTADTLDLSTGAARKSTLTGNVTYTLTNPVTGGSYVIRILTGAGSFTVTWPATVKWPGGVAPVITTTASRMDLVNLYWDGTNYYGSFSQNYTP